MRLAHYQDLAVQQRLANRGIPATIEEARALRLAERTLHRWAEMECGDGNAYASWAIERDETTGKPYLCTYPYAGQPRRAPVADKEAGALRRVTTICAALTGDGTPGIHFYHQTDPRGCALYVSTEPLTDSNYNRGVCCAEG